MKRFLILLALLLPSVLHAQVSTNPLGTAQPQYIFFRGTPGGVCDGYQQGLDVNTGNFYSCFNRAWHLISGGGGGSASPAGPINSVQFNLDNVNLGGTTNFTWVDSTGTLTIGNPTFLTGKMKFAALGATGLVTIEQIGTSTANSYCFELPATVGTSGFLLTSQGGCGASMIWTSPSVTINTTSPLTGGGGVTLGGTLSLACPTCSTFASPLTTEGDLMYRHTGVDSRLAIGSNGACFLVVAGDPSWTTCPSAPITPGTQFSVAGYLTAGSTNNLGPIASPSAPDNAVYSFIETPTGGAATVQTFALAGVPGRTIAGTSDTILYTDRAHFLTYTSNSPTGVTLPQAGSANFQFNFVFTMRYTGTGAATVTPTTSTINGAATLVLGLNDYCFIYSIDNVNYLANCSHGESGIPTVADSGSANAYVVASPLVQALTKGSFIFFTVGNANTAASTINVAGLGVKALDKFGATALNIGDLLTTAVYMAVYDGTEWQLLNPGTFTVGTSFTTPFWYAVDSGAVNAYVVAPIPAVTALTAGTIISFSTANANTSAATLNVSGLGVKALDKKAGSALVSGDILATPAIYVAVYDGTEWELINPSTGSGGAGTVNNCSVAHSLADYRATGTTIDCDSEALMSQYQYAADSGVANAYVTTLAPALTSLQTGEIIEFSTTLANTTASTINVNGLGVKNIDKFGTNALASGDIKSGVMYVLLWDGTEWQLLNPSSGSNSFPLTVAGTVNSGGIPCFTSATNEASSATIAANTLIKGGGAGACVAASSITDDGTTVTTTDTGGMKAPTFISTGTTAGFIDLPQGTTSAAVSPCNTSTSICEQAPTAVTSYLVVKPGVAANGVVTNNVAAAVDTQGFSGDSNHSTTVTTGSGTSIGSTSLCSTAICTVGTYRVNVYIDITTACGTTGTYIVNLIYTDDQGSKTVPMNIAGTGAVPATGILTTTSTANFGQETQIIRSTGAASINYSTTATACGTAGPMVGKLYLSVEPLQ